MPAKPKLSDEQRAQARKTWEADSRDGFAWLVSELGLPVSAPGIRKVCVKEGWEKSALQKPSKPSEVSARNHRNHRNDVADADTDTDEESSGHDASGALVGLILDARSATPHFDSLDPREKTFVLEYAQHSNGTKAAKNAGYSEAGAAEQARRLLRRAEIKSALQEVMREKVENAGWNIERLIKHYADLADVDTSKITQHRIAPCRYCWGINHSYQCTPVEYASKRAEHVARRKRLLEQAGGDLEADIGEFPSIKGDWYDGRLEPNPDCPECHGNGKPYVWFADVRNLTGAERKAYTGVKRTKDGIELLFQKPEEAVKMLATAVGMGKEQEKPETPVEVAREYAKMMEAARERQRRVYEERGITREPREDRRGEDG
ncbi:hypothetical protein GCM10028811_12880 [Uliginosibacterium sediminicola]